MRDNRDQLQCSCIDLRMQGESDQSTEDEERKRSRIKSPVKHILESPNNDKLLAELFPTGDDKEYQGISQHTKNFVKEQGSLEAHENLMITDTVQCKSCCHYALPRQCGRVLPGASDEVKKHVLKNVINCFNTFTTSAFVLTSGTPRGKTIGSSKGVSFAKELCTSSTITFSSDI